MRQLHWPPASIGSSSDCCYKPRMLAFGLLLICIAVGWRRPGFLIAPLFYGYTADVLGAPGGMSTAIVSASAAAILVIRQWRSLASLRFTALDLAVLAFLVWHSISATWMPNANYGASQIPNLLMSTLSVYVAARLLGRLPDPSDRANEVAWGLALLGSSMAVLLTTQGSVVDGRLRLGDASAVGLAQPYPLAALAALFLVFSAARPTYKSIAFVCFIVLLYTAIISGTRGAVLALAAGMIALFLFASHRQKLITVMIGVLAAVVGGACFIMMGIGAETTLRVFELESYGSASDASSLDRMLGYEIAWSMISSSPIFGNGLGSFSYFAGYDYPHNVFLEIWSQSGAIGIFLFIFAAILFIRRQATATRSFHETAIIVALVAAGFMQQQVSFSLPIGKTIFLIGFFSAYVPLLRGGGVGSTTGASISAVELMAPAKSART